MLDGTLKPAVLIGILLYLFFNLDYSLEKVIGIGYIMLFILAVVDHYNFNKENIFHCPSCNGLLKEYSKCTTPEFDDPLLDFNIVRRLKCEECNEYYKEVRS